ARAAVVVRNNIKALGAHASVTRVTAERYLRDSPPDAFGLELVDPPYAVPTEQVAALVAIIKKAFAEPEALFVVERATRDPFVWPEGVEPLRHKAYGDTTLWYGH
ncbi:RsmD family RNA methyltransferase, partial [Aeromicrobium sp.]|uniref:RsmD family RNA methyltransferase n=1 Tax=Aeromicrobium sp. TaxID=1871063 RepID=UPI00199121BA